MSGNGGFCGFWSKNGALGAEKSLAGVKNRKLSGGGGLSGFLFNKSDQKRPKTTKTDHKVTETDT